MQPKLFPHETVRAGQRSLVRHIVKNLEAKTPLLAHAPTGLGKTAAALAPALEIALDKGLTIFFLTSRHTQHLIALETIKHIRKRHGTQVTAVSIVGKKHMCLQPGVSQLHSGEFSEFCKNLKENKQCEYYLESRSDDGKSTVQAEKSASKLKVLSPLSSSMIMDEGRNCKLCPYELAMDVAKKATVIITDYYYIFNPSIRERFFKKLNLSLDKCIVIVDEGHNLPDRVRNLFSETLSTGVLQAAKREAEKFNYEGAVPVIDHMHQVLLDLSSGSEEALVEKGAFMKSISSAMPYTEIMDTLEEIGEAVTHEQKRSACSSVAHFLELWAGADEGYARIISRRMGAKGRSVQLMYKCMDPSIVTSEVIEQSYWTLVMSGTLNPPEMYRDLLGFDTKADYQEYGSPFSVKNRLAMVVPKTTTKYSMRSEDQFKNMSTIITDMVERVPGNCAVFFPSYALRDQVYRYLQTQCPRTIFLEDSKLSKDGRADLLERFKAYEDTGAVLLGVAGGSFGEGIDLPGDLLKCVIVVGLPLGRPDLETQELIKYYDGKFSQGWNYGYVLPAFTKTLQNAGRCIRTEKDRGVLVFLDERYAWPSYLRCFPADWEVEVTSDYAAKMDEFFENTSKP